MKFMSQLRQSDSRNSKSNYFNSQSSAAYPPSFYDNDLASFKLKFAPSIAKREEFKKSQLKKNYEVENSLHSKSALAHYDTDTTAAAADKRVMLKRLPSR